MFDFNRQIHSKSSGYDVQSNSKYLYPTTLYYLNIYIYTHTDKYMCVHVYSQLVDDFFEKKCQLERMNIIVVDCIWKTKEKEKKHFHVLIDFFPCCQEKLGNSIIEGKATRLGVVTQERCRHIKRDKFDLIYIWNVWKRMSRRDVAVVES